MFYTLGLMELPFLQDSRQIIYVDGQGNEAVGNLVRQHYDKIRSYYKSKGYDFCFIPMLKKELSESESFQYNVPYSECGNVKYIKDDNFILEYMLHPENREKIGPSLLFYHPDCIDRRYNEDVVQFKGIWISESSFKGDDELKDILDTIITFINNKKEDRLNIITAEDIQQGMDDYPCCSDNDLFRDGDWDDETMILMKEVEERIEKLKQRGVKGYILRKLVNGEKIKISRLQITKDYRIFLPDYNNMEIKMTPLPKSLYLLYLKHPEGIMFSYLPDYREELMEIYKGVKGTMFNSKQARKSIDDVTDPLKNSINENCSRIREAFVSQFEDHLAHYYYVDGERGEAKRISLPSEYIVWE